SPSLSHSFPLFLSVLTDPHSLCSVLFPLSEDKSITVQSGQNVILPCQAPNDKGSIRVVKWTKPDLQKKIVHLYVDRRFDLEDQNPSFKNRVDLQDREMKNGDVSLILNNVTINDAGTYECSVIQKKDLSPSTTTITLDLRFMALLNWSLVCIFPLCFSLLLLFFSYRKFKEISECSNQPQFFLLMKTRKEK
uniref:Ig-like domain-containing protein n=1 Tax=Maylandia zebra TaxID=106582 RepID=A0A3P9DDQ4_9CICH